MQVFKNFVDLNRLRQCKYKLQICIASLIQKYIFHSDCSNVVYSIYSGIMNSISIVHIVLKTSRICLNFKLLKFKTEFLKVWVASCALLFILGTVWFQIGSIPISSGVAQYHCWTDLLGTHGGPFCVALGWGPTLFAFVIFKTTCKSLQKLLPGCDGFFQFTRSRFWTPFWVWPIE